MATSTFSFCSPPSLILSNNSYHYPQKNRKLDKDKNKITLTTATTSSSVVDEPPTTTTMELFIQKLKELLKCPVCHHDLINPVTLSCGYTVCQGCIPAPIQQQHQQQSLPSQQQQQHPIFLCPVPECRYTTHLFGRAQELCIDSVVQSLCLMFHYSSHSSPSSQNLSTSASSSNHNNNKRKHATISSSSSSSSSSSNMMETNNDLSITTAEQKQQQIEELMQCNQCQGTFYQPITTHCGHVYCRLCLLKLKLNGEACPSCQCALPRYNFVQNQAAQNRILIRLFKLMDQLQQSTSSTNNRITKIAQRQQRSIPYNMIAIPMFVTGVVILPRQHTRIPIYMPNHIRMLRQAAFASQQYDGLCLPAVHRGRPNLSQYGTLVEIVSVEHYLNNDGSTSFTIEVCGRERFCTHCTDYEERNMEDLSVLISDIDIVPEITPAFNNKNDNNNSGISTTHAIASSSNHNSPMSSRGGVFDTTLQHQTRIEELALQVYMFIEEIAAAPPLENISNNVHTSTVGLLGPFWFETMERIHGKLPSRYEPAALIWWTATILPVSGAERYALLRTINLQDRLELVLSWIKQLDGQWKRWRQTAVNAVAAAIQPQLEK